MYVSFKGYFHTATQKLQKLQACNQCTLVSITYTQSGCANHLVVSSDCWDPHYSIVEEALRKMLDLVSASALMSWLDRSLHAHPHTHAQIHIGSRHVHAQNTHNPCQSDKNWNTMASINYWRSLI